MSRLFNGIVLAVLAMGTIPAANAEIIALEGFTLESSGSTQILLPPSFGLVSPINVNYNESDGVPTSATVHIKLDSKARILWEGEPFGSNGTQTQDGIFFAATSSQGQEGATLVDLSGTDISEYFQDGQVATFATALSHPQSQTTGPLQNVGDSMTVGFFVGTYVHNWVFNGQSASRQGGSVDTNQPHRYGYFDLALGSLTSTGGAANTTSGGSITAPALPTNGATVPEPGSFAVIAICLSGVGLYRRRRDQRLSGTRG